MQNPSVDAAGDHYRIVPTARVLAYFRSFSDIPYAEETSKALRGEEATRQLHQEHADNVTRFVGPFAEARYKCFDRFLESYNNVLELAVGTSIERGLTVSGDPSKIYVGTDLPGIIGESRQFLKRIDGEGRHGNHFLEAANVLSYEQLESAVSHFGERRRLMILNEGLFVFLTRDEQVVCAENIRRILHDYGGSWFTPDIIDRESDSQFIGSLGPDIGAMIKGMSQRLIKATGRDVEKNYFDTRGAAASFFRELGFNVTQYPMVSDFNSLASVRKLWGDQERSLYEPGLTQSLVWELSL